jgi:hypothetical protein
LIVTVATYQSTTGDNTFGPTVSAKLEEAQERLEDVLDRPLEAISRTGVLIPGRDGTLSPRAVPIMSVDAGWMVADDRIVPQYLINAPNRLWWYPALGPTITYVGGWVERTANPNATNRLPICISDDLCWAAWRLLNPVDPNALTAFPPGATSVQLGDAAVSFGGAGGSPAANGRALSAVRWSPATLRYRYRGNRGSSRRC